MIHVPLLNSQTIGLSDFVNVIGFRSGRKIRLLREVLRNMGIKSRIFTKCQSARRRGAHQLGDLANMDRTPLPFVMNEGKTYDKTGADGVWLASVSSGLDKRQCMEQLSIFADGKPMMPLIIF